MKVSVKASSAEEMRDIIVKWHRQQAAKAINDAKGKRLQRDIKRYLDRSSFHNDAADFIQGIEVLP